MAKPKLMPEHVIAATHFFDQAAAATGAPREAFNRLESTFRIAAGMEERPASDPDQQPGIFMPGLTAKPWHEAADYALARQLEESYGDIKRELLSLYDDLDELAVHRQTRRLIKQGKWTEFSFYLGVQRHDENSERCPETARVLDAYPRKCLLGAGKYSVLAPESHIEPHCGPNNLRIRFHLGLVIPEGCEIRVKDETRSWEEGKCLVLDDSFEHEVWNRSDQTRIILLVDSWHPELTEIEVQALEKLVPMLRAELLQAA